MTTTLESEPATGQVLKLTATAYIAFVIIIALLLCGCKTSQKSDWQPRLGLTP